MVLLSELVKCVVCGKEEIVNPSRAKHYKTCSNICKSIYRKSLTPKETTCMVCGKHFHLKKSYRGKRTVWNGHCCSYECGKKMRSITMIGSLNHQYGLRGNKNASFKTGIVITCYGYELTLVPEHPFANCDGRVFTHRLVAEKYLLTDENSVEIDGVKYLSSKYSVHHKDFNKLNNSVDNLAVMTKGEHMKLHQRLRKIHKSAS